MKFSKIFVINLAENSHIWREIFEILKKKLKNIEKNTRLLKKTQCYGVNLTQSNSLKAVKKMPAVRPFSNLLDI